MKLLKRIITTPLILASFAFVFSAKAERFDFTPKLVDQIKGSVSNSGFVVKERAGTSARKGAGLSLCKYRLQLLRGILESEITPSKVKHIIGNYLRDAHVDSTSREAVLLGRTVTVEDLKYNVGVLIQVYDILK